MRQEAMRSEAFSDAAASEESPLLDALGARANSRARRLAHEIDDQALSYPIFQWIQRWFNGSALIMGCLMFTLVLTRSLDVVLYIRVTKKMTNYPWFLSSILLTLSFALLCWPVVWFKIWRGSITPEMRTFPKSKFAVAGALDAIANLISTVPASFLSGPVNVVVSQAVVPATLLAGIAFQRTRFQWTHFLGAFVIALAVAVQAAPNFDLDLFGDFDFAAEGAVQGSAARVPPPSPEGHSGPAPPGPPAEPSNLWWWTLLLIASTLPNAGSNVYKDCTFKEAQLDVWYYNAWVALFQLLAGAALVPAIFAPSLNGMAHMHKRGGTLFEIGDYVADATGCFLGYDTRAGDRCDGGAPTWSVLAAFITLNVMFNIVMVIVHKHGSATLAIASSVLRLVTSDLLFGVPLLAGEAAGAMGGTDGVALLVIVAGLVLYRMEEPLPAAPEARWLGAPFADWIRRHAPPLSPLGDRIASGPLGRLAARARRKLRRWGLGWLVGYETYEEDAALMARFGVASAAAGGPVTGLSSTSTRGVAMAKSRAAAAAAAAGAGASMQGSYHAQGSLTRAAAAAAAALLPQAHRSPSFLSVAALGANDFEALAARERLSLLSSALLRSAEGAGPGAGAGGSPPLGLLRLRLRRRRRLRIRRGGLPAGGAGAGAAPSGANGYGSAGPARPHLQHDIRRDYLRKLGVGPGAAQPAPPAFARARMHMGSSYATPPDDYVPAHGFHD
eukprot:tig00001042_g6604.t1